MSDVVGPNGDLVRRLGNQRLECFRFSARPFRALARSNEIDGGGRGRSVRLLRRARRLFRAARNLLQCPAKLFRRRRRFRNAAGELFRRDADPAGVVPFVRAVFLGGSGAGVARLARGPLASAVVFISDRERGLCPALPGEIDCNPPDVPLFLPIPNLYSNNKLLGPYALSASRQS